MCCAQQYKAGLIPPLSANRGLVLCKWPTGVGQWSVCGGAQGKVHMERMNNNNANYIGGEVGSS